MKNLFDDDWDEGAERLRDLRRSAEIVAKLIPPVETQLASYRAVLLGVQKEIEQVSSTALQELQAH